VINKGKASMTQECHPTTSYKEALSKPPLPKVIRQLKEDNCICDRCDQIMARVLAMAACKNDQDYKLKTEGGVDLQ
jgi:hypothetical protein